MNEYTFEFYCGQIRYVKEFFAEYEDNYVSTTVEQTSRIKVLVIVKTLLSTQEALKHLENVFKQSKFGCALHFTAKAVGDPF